MSRYIDFYLIGELVDSHGNVHYEDLKSLPTADVVERKRGKWLLDGRCSECLVVPLTSHKNFCPNCGADMRGTLDD